MPLSLSPSPCFRPWRCRLDGTARKKNPYDNAKAESFMKTLKVEAVYPMAYETFTDVAEDLPRLSSTNV